MKNSRLNIWSGVLLVLIVVGGLFLRVYHLNDLSLWLDEGITYYNSSGESFGAVWEKTAELDQSPPLYYFIMHGYLEIFGENEFGFRLIPAIFGVLSILLLYYLGKALFNKEVGLVAAFLLAINPFHIGFSMESRMYVLLSLLSIAAVLTLYKAMIAKKIAWGYWLMFAISCIAGIYTHNFFVFVLAALFGEFFVLLFYAKKKMGKFFMGVLSATVVIASFYPWLDNFKKQLSVERYWMAPNTFTDLKNYFLDFVNQNEIIFYLFISLAVFGIIWHLFSRKSRLYRGEVFSTLILIIFLIAGILVPLFYSLKFEPILKIRYVVYIVPVFMLLAALGIYTIGRFRWWLILPFLALPVYLWNPWQLSAYPMEINEQFRELAEEVKENPAPVIVHSPSIAHVINFYGKGKFEVNPFPLSDDLRDYNFGEEMRGKFRQLTRSLDAYYLVVSHTHENPPGLLYGWSKLFCKKETPYAFDGMQAFYFEDCR